MDPVIVYGETDVVRWMVRSASYSVIAKDQQDAADKAKKQK